MNKASVQRWKMLVVSASRRRCRRKTARSDIGTCNGMAEQLYPDADHAARSACTSRILPTPEADAIRPQKMSGCSEMSWGPGVMPWMVRAAEQQGHHGVAGNTEAHGRDEVALDGGVGGSFGGSRHRLDARRGRSGRACARRRFFSDGIGRQRRRWSGPVPGNERAKAADQRATDDRATRIPGGGQLRLGAHVPEAELHAGQVCDRLDAVHALEELRHPEEAERERHDLDAVRTASSGCRR